VIPLIAAVRRGWGYRLSRLALLVAGSCICLTGCGSPTRSVASYCSYFSSQGRTLEERWSQSNSRADQNPFSALSSVFADLPEAVSFLHELSLRAPEPIGADVQTLSEALKQASSQVGAGASDPLGALAGGLAEGLEYSGVEQRVNEYTKQNCAHLPSS